MDAIVNPANSLGIMATGVSGELRRRSGDSIQSEAMRAAPIAVGAALVTTAGKLPAKHVIHAPIMDEPGMRISAENIRRAARAALLAADANGFQEIAFPGMGKDASGVDLHEAARAIVEEIRAHRRACPVTAYLVDTSAEMVEAFEIALENAQFGL